MAAQRAHGYAIIPEQADEMIGELLALDCARVLVMRAGEAQKLSVGGWMLAAAAEGSVSVSARSDYALLDAGRTLLLCGAAECCVEAVLDSLCFVMHMRGELPQRIFAARLGEGNTCCSDGAAFVRECMGSLHMHDAEHSPVRADTASQLCYGLLLRLFALPERGRYKQPSLVESAIAIIQEEFSLLKGLDDLAGRLGVSKAHLSRCFTQKTGVSPGRYITRTKLEFAKLLLQERGTSVTYAAEASGFANANYFAKVFRRETGVSPSEYIKLLP